MISDSKKEYLISLIQNNEEIPEEFKEILFPVSHKDSRKKEIIAAADTAVREFEVRGPVSRLREIKVGKSSD